MENKKEPLLDKIQPLISDKFIVFSSIIIFTAASLLAVFLFTNSAGAQSIRDYSSPRYACQAFRGQQGFSIIRDTEHECLVRNGSGQAFVNTRFFDSGGNFCLEVTSSIGQIVAPQCMPISQTGRAEQQRQENPDKIVTPPAFQIKELQYDTLPTGKPIESGDNERIEIKLSDGSLIQLDANATFTPVSKYEVQSVFGRYRYLWQPFHDGKCIVGQNLVRQECRKVKTRDAILGDKGTEFLVDTDKNGTTVTVLDGIVIAADLNGKKTIEIPAGQSAYIKHGGLPEDPKPFDSSKLDRWWEKKTSEQISETVIGIMVIVVVFIVILCLISLAIKRIFRRGKPVVEEKTSDGKSKKRTCLGVLVFIFVILVLISLIAFVF